MLRPVYLGSERTVEWIVYFIYILLLVQPSMFMYLYVILYYTDVFPRSLVRSFAHSLEVVRLRRLQSLWGWLCVAFTTAVTRSFAPSRISEPHKLCIVVACLVAHGDWLQIIIVKQVILTYFMFVYFSFSFSRGYRSGNLWFHRLVANMAAHGKFCKVNLASPAPRTD